MRKTPTLKLATVLALAALAGGSALAQTAYWTNSAGGEWNTAANWDFDFFGINVVPAVGTNANIGSSGTATVDYNTPMAAASFNGLALGAGSVLNVNTTGFNLDAGGASASTIAVGGTLNVNAGGALTATNAALFAISGGSAVNLGGSAVLSGGALGFAPIALDGALNVNSGGSLVNTNGGLLVMNGGRLTVNAGGTALFSSATPTTTNAVAGITNAAIAVMGGTLSFSNSGTVAVALVSSLGVTNGVFEITNSASTVAMLMGVNNNTSIIPFNIDGGTVSFDRLLDLRGHFTGVTLHNGTLNCYGGSRITEQGNDRDARIVVNGGVANLGNFSVDRVRATGGLLVSNGVANATSLRIGCWNSACYSTVAGGVLTNTGPFLICDRTNGAASGTRSIFFNIYGGSVVSTDAGGVVIANQGQAFNNLGVSYGVMGTTLNMYNGLLLAEKITLVRDTTISNAHARLYQFGGTIYVGSGGVEANVGTYNTTYQVNLNGGTYAAKANHAVNANVTLGGTIQAIQAADSTGSPFNIAMNGVVSGSSVLAKTGGGTLTYNNFNTCSGNTFINAGTLALGASGSISNVPQITLASGATFDVSAVTGGYVLNSLRTLAGSGQVAGNVSAASGSTLNPGSNTVAGTLTFQNTLVESGGVINHFDLSGSPAGNNDFISIGGDLTVSGLNTIEISGSVASFSVYPLIQYGGNFNGDLSNFSLVGVTASLSNSTTAKTIYLVVESGIRAPTSVVWVGNATANIWDLATATNWLNGSVADYFVAGDTVLFNNTGATHPEVSLVGNVAPAALTVGASGNYTFTGAGAISGNTGLTKTNSGTLTVLSTNSYAGPTLLGGGWLEAATVRNNGTPSSIGAAGVDPANLVFDGGNLRYIGSANSTTDRGATLNANSIIEVTNGAATLTVNGSVVGNGALAKAGPGALVLSGANTYAGVTTISNGVLQINTAITALGTNAVNLAGGTLFLNVGGQPSYFIELHKLAVSGLNVAGNNTIFNPTNWTGSAALNVNINTNGYFTINSEINPLFTGTIALGASEGTFRFNAGGNSASAQQCNGSTNVGYDLGTGYAILVNRNGGGDTYGNYYLGGLAGGPNTLVRGSANSGSPSTYVIGFLNENTTFAGTIQNGLANTATPQAAAAVSINKVGTGTLTLTGTNAYSGITTITNGTLALSGDGSILTSPAIHVVPGAKLASYGRTDGTLTLAPGQTLDGSGTLQGSLTVGTNAILSPGDANGVFDYPVNQFTVTNALVFLTGGTNKMDVDVYTPTNDSVSALSIVYGGTLEIAGSGFADGNSFKLFNAATYGGAFEAINPANPDGNPALTWDTSQLTVNGTLRVITTPAPLPVIGQVIHTGSDLIFSGTGGAAFGAYNVLSSTNAGLALSEWTFEAAYTFEADGSFSVTNAVSPTVPEKYYLIQLP